MDTPHLHFSDPTRAQQKVPLEGTHRSYRKLRSHYTWPLYLHHGNHSCLAAIPAKTLHKPHIGGTPHKTSHELRMYTMGPTAASARSNHMYTAHEARASHGISKTTAASRTIQTRHKRLQALDACGTKPGGNPKSAAHLLEAKAVHKSANTPTQLL